MNEKPQVDSATALEMWNAGATLARIAAHFHCSRRSAQWAIIRAEKHGLGIARRGCVKPEPVEPPFVALWSDAR